MILECPEWLHVRFVRAMVRAAEAEPLQRISIVGRAIGLQAPGVDAADDGIPITTERIRAAIERLRTGQLRMRQQAADTTA